MCSRAPQGQHSLLWMMIPGFSQDFLKRNELKQPQAFVGHHTYRLGKAFISHPIHIFGQTQTPLSPKLGKLTHATHISYSTYLGVCVRFWQNYILFHPFPEFFPSFPTGKVRHVELFRASGCASAVLLELRMEYPKYIIIFKWSIGQGLFIIAFTGLGFFGGIFMYFQGLFLLWTIYFQGNNPV